MASLAANACDIPMSEQHEFLDLAKEFEWEKVKRHITANPALVNVQPARRWSALHQAAFSGNVDVLHFLLGHQAAIHVTTTDGKTPMDVAKNGQVKSMLSDFSDTGKLPTPLRVKPATAKPSKCEKKTTKVIKAMKAKKSKIAKGKGGKALVYKEKFQKTSGGLTKDHLTKNKAGKTVSKRMQAHGKKSYANLKGWVEAFVKARASMGLKGFVAVKKGSALYARTMELYKL